jgi:HemK-related putative methylase
MSQATVSSNPAAVQIQICSAIGVSPVGEDTRLIAEKVSQLEFDDALEVGTGTGYVAIHLARLGRRCRGVDINPLAIECARANAAANGVDVAFDRSDLFDNVEGTFDLIIFNPPYGSAGGAGPLGRLMDVVKSLLPKENEAFSRFVYLFVRRGHRRLVHRFLTQARTHLRPGGSLVIHLHERELDLFDGMPYEVLGRIPPQSLVRVRGAVESR